MSKGNVEFIDSKKDSDEQKGRSIKDTLKDAITGSLVKSLILKNIGFIAWLTFLGIVYIGNRYQAEKVARTMTSLQREVKDLRAESITTAAELMYLSRQSVVVQMVKSSHLDLQESVKPPFKVEK